MRTTAFAPDALGRVYVDDPIRPLLKGADRADRDAWGVRALIAPEDCEVAPDRGEGSGLRIFDPGTEVPDGDAVLALASDGAGVTADAPGVVDDEA